MIISMQNCEENSSSWFALKQMSKKWWKQRCASISHRAAHSVGLNAQNALLCACVRAIRCFRYLAIVNISEHPARPRCKDRIKSNICLQSKARWRSKVSGISSILYHVGCFDDTFSILDDIWCRWSQWYCLRMIFFKVCPVCIWFIRLGRCICKRNVQRLWNVFEKSYVELTPCEFHGPNCCKALQQLQYQKRKIWGTWTVEKIPISRLLPSVERSREICCDVVVLKQFFRSQFVREWTDTSKSFEHIPNSLK